MPVFNGARTLQRTLESLESQANDIEVIAVIQATSDGSRDIIHHFLHRVPIVIVEAPHSKNWMQTTNLGLAAARAAYCTFLHQDDIWSDGRLDALSGLVRRHPNAALWVHEAAFIDDRDQPLGRFAPPFGNRERVVPIDEALTKLLIQNTISLPAVMFRRDTVLKLGGLDEELWYTADWDLWLKLAQLGGLAWLPRCLAGFRLHASSLTVSGSRDLADFRQQMEIVLDRHAGALPESRRAVVKRMASASIDLNVCLAGIFHGGRSGCGTTLASIMSLGPAGVYRFVKTTQIISRLMSRARALSSP